MNIRQQTIAQVEQIRCCQSVKERFRLLLELAGSPDQWGRIQAMEFLGQIVDAQSRQVLAIALHDGVSFVAHAAATALVQHRTDQALKTLVDTLVATEEGECQHLANAVAQFDEAGLPYLIELASSGSVTQRHAAVRNLARFKGNALAEDALRRSLADEGLTPAGASVSIAAKNALRKLRRVVDK